MANVYCITNKRNGKRYIGFTTYPVDKRWRDHVSAANTNASDQVIHKAIRKYGPDHFSVECVGTYQTVEDGLAAEERAIKELNTMVPDGYNLTPGGNFSATYQVGHTEETKQKLSELKGHTVTIAGVEYPSYRAADEALGLYSGCICKRVNKYGRNRLTLEEAIGSKERPVTLDGVNYASISEAAEKTGISRSAITAWLDEGKTTTEYQNPPAVPVTIDGVKFPTVKAAAEHFGVARGTVEKWVNRYGGHRMRFDVTRKLGAIKTAKRTRKPVVIAGVKHESLTAAAKAEGVVISTIKNWVKRRPDCFMVKEARHESVR